jgi:hypothetical protein
LARVDWFQDSSALAAMICVGSSCLSSVNI